jgi:hypothetical protein
LEEQLREIQNRNRGIEEVRRIVENTYKTMDLASDIANMINLSNQHVAFVKQFRLPEIKLFRNSELSNAIDSLEARLERFN